MAVSGLMFQNACLPAVYMAPHEPLSSFSLSALRQKDAATLSASATMTRWHGRMQGCMMCHGRRARKVYCEFVAQVLYTTPQHRARVQSPCCSRRCGQITRMCSGFSCSCAMHGNQASYAATRALWRALLHDLLWQPRCRGKEPAQEALQDPRARAERGGILHRVRAHALPCLMLKMQGAFLHICRC